MLALSLQIAMFLYKMCRSQEISKGNGNIRLQGEEDRKQWYKWLKRNDEAERTKLESDM